MHRSDVPVAVTHGPSQLPTASRHNSKDSFGNRTCISAKNEKKISCALVECNLEEGDIAMKVRPKYAGH